MILEGLAALFGLALLSGSDKEEKKKEINKKRKKRNCPKNDRLIKNCFRRKNGKKGRVF